MPLHAYRSPLDDRVPGDNIDDYDDDSTDSKMWKGSLSHKNQLSICKHAIMKLIL